MRPVISSARLDLGQVRSGQVRYKRCRSRGAVGRRWVGGSLLLLEPCDLGPPFSYFKDTIAGLGLGPGRSNKSWI